MNPTPESPLRWALFGPGQIAEVFASALARSGAGTAVSVLGRNPEKTRAFAARHGLRAEADAQAALAGADAVYIATPHSLHHAMTLQALQAGVAVLCEKPYSLRAADAAEAVALSQQLRVPFAEAWMYRAHPGMARLCGLIRSGDMGPLRNIASWFGFNAPDNGSCPRLFDPAHGGGAIWDVGGYPLSAAMLMAGAAAGSDWAAPESMRCSRRESPAGVDLASHAQLRFAGGLTADLNCAIDTDWGMGLTLTFAEGAVRVPDPFLAEGKRMGRAMHLNSMSMAAPPSRQEIKADEDVYTLEIRAFSRAVAAGALCWEAPMVGHGETVALAGALETWRTQACDDTEYFNQPLVHA